MARVTSQASTTGGEEQVTGKKQKGSSLEPFFAALCILLYGTIYCCAARSNCRRRARFVFSVPLNGCASRSPATQAISSLTHTRGHFPRARLGSLILTKKSCNLTDFPGIPSGQKRSPARIVLICGLPSTKSASSQAVNGSTFSCARANRFSSSTVSITSSQFTNLPSSACGHCAEGRSASQTER